LRIVLFAQLFERVPCDACERATPTCMHGSKSARRCIANQDRDAVCRFDSSENRRSTAGNRITIDSVAAGVFSRFRIFRVLD